MHTCPSSAGLCAPTSRARIFLVSSLGRALSSSCPAAWNQSMLPANHTCARTPGAVSGSVYFPVLVAEEAAKATLVQGIRPCSCSQCPPPFPLTSRPFPWSLLVTNGHKCIPDIPGHLLVDGVLHIIVGHPDELLEDWPQEKPRRLGVSDSSERGGSPLPCPSSSARKVEGAPGMTTAQGLGVLDRITTGWKFR